MLSTSFIFLVNGAKGNDTLSVKNVIDYPRHIHFFTKLGYTFSDLEISNVDLNKDLQYEPSVSPDITIGAYYSWLGLSYNFTIPASDDMKNQFGKTVKKDFEAHIMKRRLIADFSIKNYKGFYLSNMSDFIKGWDEKNVYPQVPDLKVNTISLSAAYIFNPYQYSSKAAYAYSETKLSRGGSWMLGAFASVGNITSDSSLVPSAIRQYADPKINLKRLNYSNLGLSFGYSYLFTFWKKYFTSISFLPGISYQEVSRQSSVDGSIDENKGVSFRSLLHFSVGHNSEKFYWGTEVFMETSDFTYDVAEIMINSGSVNLFFGYRLPTDNWQSMKRIDRVLHPHFLRFITGNPPERN
jgi:hypothetical protein